MRTTLSSQFDAETIKRTKPRIVERNTFKRDDRGVVIIRLHATDIVTFHRSHKVTLNSGGYRTKTTRERMNTYLTGGYSVTSGDGFWNVRDCETGETVPYFDGITLPDAFREGPQNKRAWRERKREIALKDAIKAAIAKLPKSGAVPFESGNEEVHENKYMGYPTSGARGQGDARILRIVRSGRIPSSVVRDACTWSGRNPSYCGYGTHTNGMVRRYLGAKLGLVVR
jgi:hypothetical protein